MLRAFETSFPLHFGSNVRVLHPACRGRVFVVTLWAVRAARKMASGSRAESLSRNKGAQPRPSAIEVSTSHVIRQPAPRLHVLAAVVLTNLSHKVTNKFKSFCKTELMDRFLYACIEYFTFFFELQARPPHPLSTAFSLHRILSPPRPSPLLQKILTDAAEEVAKREQLHAFTQEKASKHGSSPPKPLPEPERNVAAIEAEEEARK